MVLASEIQAGTAFKLGDRIHKVLEVIHHAGTGQVAGFTILKLKDVQYAHLSERRFKATDKLDEVELTKKKMQYIYNEDEMFLFMDPVTYDQVGIPRQAIGSIDRFLKEGMKLTVELIGEEAVSVQFPRVVELKVTLTTPGIRGGQDNTLKSATLENGMEILVPQFVETGEVVRVGTETGKYVERVASKKK
ncbi:MAG: elongation factor P [Bacteroidota bacterium]